MKKIIYLLLALLVVTGAASAQTRKKSKTKKKATSSAVLPVAKGEIKEYGDYLTTQMFTVKKGKDNEVKVEYPLSGNPILVNAIREYIKNSVNDQFTGSLDTPDALLRSALKGKHDVSFGQEGESLSQELVVEYFNPNIITFKDTGYVYMGGAHGMPWVTGKTFMTSDGTPFTLDMLPSFSKMRSSIMKGLAKNFGVSVSGLKDILFDPDELNEYPGTVYITGDGIIFIYQPYEIAPFSEGAPTAIVPLTSEIINMLPDKARQFVTEGASAK